MKREEILEILNDWNIWNKEIYYGIKREDYLKKMLDFLKSNIVLVVTGVRRSGKSFILRQIMYELAKKYDKENILFVNFEDVRFEEPNIPLMEKIYETFLMYLNPKKPIIILDEVHRLKNYERWIRTMHELEKSKLIISGSNSSILKGELATLLTGRHLDITVFPLSFYEFLSFKNLKLKNDFDIIKNKIKIKRYSEEYLQYGGFPEVVLSENKKELLLNYYDDIITKDIERRYLVKAHRKLRVISRFCQTNIGNLITFNSLGKNFEITTDTAEKFINYLEEVYLIFLINKFSWKVKEQEKAARKVYSIDTGLANAIGFKFSEQKGRLIENIVAIELKRRNQFNKNLEIFYWKDYQGKEVDFVVKEGTKVKQLIQVTYASSRDEIEKREIKSLLKASEVLKCNDLLVITWDYEAEEKINNKKIKFLPLWKWLLKKDTR